MQRAAEYGGEMRRAEPTEKTARFDPALRQERFHLLVRAPSFRHLPARPHGEGLANVAHRVADSINVDEPASVGPGSCPLSWAIAQHRAIIHQARTGLPTATGVTSSARHAPLRAGRRGRRVPL